MFRFLFRVLFLAALVWASFVLEYEGKPVRTWIQAWAADAWAQAWPVGQELARGFFEEELEEALGSGSKGTPSGADEPGDPDPPAAAPRKSPRPESRVEALAEARERVAPAQPSRENPSFDHPQSAEERDELDERLRRGLR